MPTMAFFGRVYPLSRELTVPNLGPIDWGYASINLKIVHHLAINRGLVEIQCEIDREVNNDEISLIHSQAYSVVRTLTDITSFATGFSLLVVFERMRFTDGIEKEFNPGDSRLSKICTAFELSGSSLVPLLNLVLMNKNLQHALRDLTDSIIFPQHAQINCARVVESIRVMLSPAEQDRKVAWANFRAKLNISERYVREIMNDSTGPRHGQRSGSSLTSVQLTSRTWTIMNRYFEFRKRGDEPLSLSEFPELV